MSNRDVLFTADTQLPLGKLYGRLVDVAKRKTAVADTQLNGGGKQRVDAAEELGLEPASV